MPTMMQQTPEIVSVRTEEREERRSPRPPILGGEYVSPAGTYTLVEVRYGRDCGTPNSRTWEYGPENPMPDKDELRARLQKAHVDDVSAYLAGD